MKKHHYTSTINWTGDKGQGTKSYKAYGRSYDVIIDGKDEIIKGSSDSAFMGDISKHNPENLFLSSIASCHMLWYLHLCSVNNITVLSYTDQAKGTMEEKASGSGRFTEVTLEPQVVIVNNDNTSKAVELHSKANQMCFIANSLNFKIEHNPKITIQ